MNITIVFDIDIAGQGRILWHGFNDLTSHKARFIVFEETYLKYETDLKVGVDDEEIKKVLENTDFFLFGRGFWLGHLAERLGAKFEISPNDYLIAVYGSEARANPGAFLYQWLRGNAMIVSSMDYSNSSLIGFSAQHIPISINLDEIPRKYGKKTHTDIRIVHTPTNRGIKQTEIFLKAVEKVKKKNPEVVPFLIEKKPWKLCLSLKIECDIMYDQMLIGAYGFGAVESLAMEQPVLGRANSWVRSFYPDCPIIDCTPTTLADRITALVENPDWRRNCELKGRMFCEDVHDVKRTIRQWENLIKFVKTR